MATPCVLVCRKCDDDVTRTFRPPALAVVGESSYLGKVRGDGSPVLVVLVWVERMTHSEALTRMSRPVAREVDEHGLPTGPDATDQQSDEWFVANVLSDVLGSPQTVVPVDHGHGMTTRREVQRGKWDVLAPGGQRTLTCPHGHRVPLAYRQALKVARKAAGGYASI